MDSGIGLRSEPDQGPPGVLAVAVERIQDDLLPPWEVGTAGLPVVQDDIENG